MSRILLILPSSTYRASDFLDAAETLDAEVVVGCDERQTMSDTMGERALELDLEDPELAAEQIVAHADRVALDAIVAVDDRGVLPAALASERLGLAHNPPGAVATTRDKARLRQALAGHVPQPAHRAAHVGDDVAELAFQVGFPCVIKPVSLSASRGVIRVDDREEAAAAAERIRHILTCSDADPDGPLLVEAYVPGREVAVEGLVRDGTLEVLAVFDKPDPLEGPYFEETLYVTPSRESDQVLERIHEVTADAVAAVGLREGPVHAEARIRPDGPDGGEVVFLELAARSIGGLCSRALRFGLGVSLEELLLRHALGRPLEGLQREPAASGVMMLPIPRAGTLRSVDGRDAARAVDGIVGLRITIADGTEVEPLPDGDRYLGFLFARSETPADVERSLREAASTLDARIEPAS